MKTKNFLTNLCGLSKASQCSDIGFDRRLTVGSPSGRYRSAMHKFISLLALVLIVGIGNVWGATLTYTHDFTTTISSATDVTLSTITWTASSLSNVGAYNSSNYKGIQIGTGKKTGGITLTSKNNWGAQSSTSYYGYTNVKKVYVWMNAGAAGTVSATVTIGGTAATSDGTTVAKNSSATSQRDGTTKVTFTPAAGHNTGAIVITVTKGTASAAAGYLCAIQVECEEPGGGCDKTVTLSYDGDASGLHGSFVLKAGSASGSTISEGGTTENCGSGTTSVVVVPTPDTHYHVASVSATNKTGTISGPDGDGNYTISYTQGSSISSEVTVTFAEDIKHTLTFYNNGVATGDVLQVYDGMRFFDMYDEDIYDESDWPTLTDGDACHATSTKFAGWTTEDVGRTPVHTIDVDKIVDWWTEIDDDMDINALWGTIPASATTTFAAADYSAATAPVTKSKDNITLYFDAGSIYKTNTPYTFTITNGDHYFSITSSDKVLAKLATTCNSSTYCIDGVSDGALSSAAESQTVTGINTYSVECYPSSSNQIRMQSCAVYCYDNYITSCCTELGSISGSVSLTTAGCGAGELKATWKMSATTGIASQILRVYDENADEVTAKRITGITASTSDQTKTISGLDPCKEYMVTVENVSSGGSYCAAGAPWESDVVTTLGYSYNITKENVSLKSGETEAARACEDFLAEYVADDGYDLPTTITVTGASDYEWDNGVLSIDKADVTGNVSVTISGVEKTCDYYSFHYGTRTKSDWNEDHLCFESSTDGDGNTGYYYYLTDFEIPNKPHYYVGWQGSWNTSDAKSADADFENMVFGLLRANSCTYQALGEISSGNNVGAIGTLRIRSSYTDNNKYIDFIPDGYVLRIGSGDSWTSTALTRKTSSLTETVFESEVVTLNASTQITSKNFYVGLKTASDYVWNPTVSQSTAVTNMGVVNGKDGSGNPTWRNTNLAAGDDGKVGMFRIWADNCSKNWNCHFVLHHVLSYDANGGSGAPASQSVAVDAASVQLTVSTTQPTRTGYTFLGWNPTKASADAGTKDDAWDGGDTHAMSANVTLYAVWQANTISLTLNKNNNDASGSENGSGTIKYDATSKTTLTAATRTGYNVEGYYTDAACTAANKVLTDAGAVVNSTVSGYTTSGKWTRATTPTTLFTKWTAKTTTVSFDQNSGTGGQTSDKTATYDQAMPTPITCPTRSGFIFGGYYDGTTSSAKQYYKADGTSSRIWDKEDATCTLYARWYGDMRAWCDPDIDISGDVYLTSYKNVYVQTTDGAGNMITISSSDLGGATDLEISYLDEDDNVVDKSESVFRLYDGSTLIDASSSTIDVSSSDAIDEDYSIRYTPNAFGQLDNYKLQIKVLRNDNVLQTKTLELHGRALPEEFVIASKKGGIWYALPNTMGGTYEDVTPIKIIVDDVDAPTEVSYAPNTVVYKGANRYRPTSNLSSIRFTKDGGQWLTMSSSNSKLELSTTAAPTEGVENQQVWHLKSTNFGAYTLKMDPSQSPGDKQLGIYNGKMGMFGNSSVGTSGEIYLLPITNKFTPIAASAHEWGEHGVIVTPATPSDLSAVKSATMHVDGASPTSATTTAVNAAMGTAKNVKVDGGALTVGAIANDGKQLYIHWKNEGGTEIGVSQIEIPCVIAADGAMKTLIGDKTIWETKEVHVLPGKTLTANAGSFGSSAVTIKELHIYPGATLDVTTGTLTATTMRLHNGWTRAGTKEYNVARVHIADDAALKKTTASIDYDIYEKSDGKHYYPLAVPFRTQVSTINYADEALASAATYGKQYGIDKYDGANRAENGATADNWVQMTTSEYLEPGKGYTITAVSSKGSAIIRIPLTFENAWTADGEKATIDDSYYKNQVSVTAYSGAASTGGGTNNRNAGWNILGVPYMSCFDASDASASPSDAFIKGKLNFITGEYTETTNVYVNVPVHDFSEYIQKPVSEAKLLPGWCFFVQFGKNGTLSFAIAGQENASSLPIYAPKREEMPIVKTGIILSDGDKSDNTTLLISDEYSAEYEIGADLEKMFGNGYTLATYSLSRDTRLAYNAMSTADAKGVIPIGFRAPEDGEYTFSLNPRYADAPFERVDLIDYQTGEVTDLMMSEYHFTTVRTQDDSRFALNVVPMAKVPTGTEQSAISNQQSDVRKMVIDDHVFIIRNGQMYDVTGKRVNVINK